MVLMGMSMCLCVSVAICMHDRTPYARVLFYLSFSANAEYVRISFIEQQMSLPFDFAEKKL